MINPQKYFESLKSLGVNFFAGVPDSLLKEFCACVSENCDSDNHIISANEGAAIALGIGNFLGTGEIPLIYLQNSGLGNVINPVLSLASRQVYGVPMIIMVGWRGEPNIKDEPQHIHQGKVMIDSLEAMELPYIILPKDQNQAILQTQNAINISKKRMSPFFVLVRKNSFDYFPVKIPPCTLQMSREDAIIAASQMVPKDGLVVCTTGMASRELFEYRASKKKGHHSDFLTVGGMGHANQIALGLCKSQPERNVFCFDGDGAALMHMGSLAIIGQSGGINLIHLIFNNGVHDSVGGQPTVGFDIDFCKIASACGYKSAIKVNTVNDVKNSINSAMKSDGPHLIEVQVHPGNRSNIGRPTSSPLKNKLDFMDNLGMNKIL